MFKHGRARAAAIVACAAVLLADPAAGREGIEDGGDFLYIAMPLSALALTVKRGDRVGRIQYYKAFGVAGLATALTKEVIDKRRPNGKDDTAFVSGHSSAAFLAAGFIHRRYGIRDAWPAYVLASYVGWTRIYAHQHDIVDVLGGAAVGVGSAFWLGERMPGVSVTPAVSRDGAAIHVAGTLGRR